MLEKRDGIYGHKVASIILSTDFTTPPLQHRFEQCQDYPCRWLSRQAMFIKVEDALETSKL